MAHRATSSVNGVDLERLREAITHMSRQPDLGDFRFRLRCRWSGAGGLSRADVEGYYGQGEEHLYPSPFALESDQPPLLSGQEQAPNPVEHLLHALATCLTCALVLNAAARGLRLDGVEVDVEGDLDLRGTLGVSEQVRPGLQRIQVSFRIDSPAPLEELRELPLSSPVLDTLVSGVPVALAVEKR